MYRFPSHDDRRECLLPTLSTFRDLGYNSFVPKHRPQSAPAHPPPGEADSRPPGLRRTLKRYLRRLTGRGSTVLESCLGRLELRVLEVLWTRPGERSVRDLQVDFPNLAYTTLMTTLDRLHKKGVLERRKEGRAYFYSSRFTREELESYLAKNAMDALLGPPESHSSMRPVLTSFVEAVSHRDELLLDELEELIRDKRRSAEPRREDSER